jgi:Outer membrane protein beta-barrel domain
MKKRFVYPRMFYNRPVLTIAVAALFFLLEGCCTTYCSVLIKPTDMDCYKWCSNEEVAKRTRLKDFYDSLNRANSSSTLPVPEQIPGEYFSTTITAGPAFSFKSSNEDYGGGYGNHEPGIGFNIGVGTVLPFNKHWAVAPAIRVTQKNASEKLEYSGTGGGGMETYIDKYSYNYLGGTMLAQYRAGKHVSFVAGPEVNFLIAASVKNGGSSGTGEKQSLNKTSQKIGLDLLAGIKFEIPADNKRSRWGVQLMYDHRISRLNKKKDENGIEVPAYKMKSVQLGLAYNICGCNKKK